MDKKQARRSINTFVKRASRRFKPEKVLLFGSFAHGGESEYSDVDIAVVSKAFSKIPQEKRLDLLYELTKDLYPDFHVFGFTPDEFTYSSKLSTIEEIKQKGIPLK